MTVAEGFDGAGSVLQLPVVSDHFKSPMLQLVQWLHRYAGFPQSRLPAQMERLLLLTVVAREDEQSGAPQSRFLFERRESAVESAQRQHAERRKRTHFKCDNSAKV